jgi:hypothetical protein
MLPRWHVVWGFVFTGILWYYVPNIGYINLLLVFLASFLIDFDHYLTSVKKTGKLGLGVSFEYYKDVHKIEKKENARGIRRKGDFHLFHTLEFHILIGLLGLVWVGFFYIFLGMIFHSLLDVVWLLYADRFYRREYFFSGWISRKLKLND